jgi:putative oxidoreductase
MKYVLWVLQVLLGLAFVAAGFPKLIQPYAELAQQMAWVSDVPEGLVRFIGVAEVLGGLGLILPAATRILPWLTPVAAAGLALDMMLATLFHLVRGEVGVVVVPLLLGLLAALVAYGRWRTVPILARPASRPAA